MVYYFSATGNSKYVAERIAGACKDSVSFFPGCSTDIALKPGEMLGIVTPVNWWELPVLTREFLSALSLKAGESPYVFLVVTYGTTPIPARPTLCAFSPTRCLRRSV